ncbi:Cirhin-like [Oopsacas minuta]|uniref:Cirhin-like n=1 Tax=Oopsacas minuta TaxID=111878 RepID=A0AAV7JJQ7_9METZ|nr:Cirhin-like [Oopsacas minuta]
MDLHCVAFLEYQPSGIEQLCLHNSSQFLAVARSNGSIEFWESKLDTFSFLNSTPICQDRLIRSLVCRGDRLFSAGLDGIISEWIFGDISEKNRAMLDIPIWCMEKSSCGGLLAVGLENGAIKIYETKYDNLEYQKDLQKQTGRILSLAWHPVGELLACGFDNSSIATFSLSNGLCLQRITLDKHNKQNTFVWQIKFLIDHTLISGNSMGKIQFWNGKFGTLKQEYTLHEELADILAIFVNEKEDTIFASGVDSKLVQLKRIEMDGNSKWIPSGSIRFHSHDVKSIVACENKFILTGGVDTKIIIHNWQRFEQKKLIKQILPFISSSRETVKVAVERKVILFQMPNKLQVWSLTKDPKSANKDVDCLLELQTNSTDGLITSAISSKADFLSWSNRKITKFYHLDWNEQDDKCISKIKQIKHAPSHPSQILAFSQHSNHVISVFNLREISIFSLSSPKNVNLHHADVGYSVVKITPSKCGKYFASVSSDSAVYIYDIDNFKIITQLSSHSSKIVSIDFAPNITNIVITYSNSEIIIFDYINQKHTEWTRSFQDFRCQDLLTSHQIELTNLTATFVRDNRLILSSYNGLCVVRLEHIPESGELETRSKKRIKIAEEERIQYHFHADNFKISSQYNSILALVHISEEEALLVERPWEEIQKEFPSELFREKYGT